jgi:flagellin
MADINLSHAVRSNLLSLQSTAANMAKTQERLATGLKVNSALDNPTNFFTASALNSRAGDMANLLDSMSNGIKTIEAADNGLKSITKTVETMQSTLRQARQDKSFKSGSYAIDTAAVTTGVTSNATAKVLSFSGGSVGTTPVNVDLATAKGVVTGAAYSAIDFAEAADSISFKLSDDGDVTTTAVTVTKGTGANTLKVTVGSTTTDNIAVTSGAAVTGAELAAAINAGFDAVGAGNGFEASFAGGALSFASNTAADASTAATTMTNFAFANGVAGTNITAAQFGFTAGGAGVSAGGTASISGVTAKTVDALVSGINAATSALSDKVRASNDNGRLRLENLSTTELSIVGVSGADGEIDGSTGASNTVTIGRNDVRRNLVTQFNELRDQLDKFADDASFNGINLLRGDKLKLTFNETGTSTIEIQAKDEAGVATAINNTSLGIAFTVPADFDSDDSLDAKLEVLADALGFLRSQASSFGSNLSIVQNRTDFTKNMINTLETGAANLTLADTNEEAANLLALQTRQQLSSTALSMASQADQAVLRLF